MFALQTFTSILAFLSFSVHAFPLSQRDVIAPPILEPNASSIWPIGTQQIVIWNTSAIPPPSQVTNPIGQIILGYNESNSLNLDFDHPLAQGFQLTDGMVMVTVPDVPPRDDYLIVLYGDSGDTSPAFAITRISAPDNSSSSAALGSTTDSSTVPATSLSSSGSATTPVFTEGIPTTAAGSTAASPPTGTTTTGSTNPTSNSNSVSAATSALAALSSTSSGCSLHRGSSIWSSAALFLMSVALVFMV